MTLHLVSLAGAALFPFKAAALTASLVLVFAGALPLLAAGAAILA